MKIRGTAHHVAEKYLQLARDAQSSGDPVMAESYLQHAEHYFRLIATAQQAQQQAAYGYQRPPGEPDQDEDNDDDFDSLPDRFASPSERAQPQQHTQPQPYQPDRQPYPNGGQHQPYETRQNFDRQNQPQPNVQQGERQPQPERPYNQERQERTYDNRNGRTDRGERGGQQPYQGGNGHQGGGQPQGDRPPRDYDNRNFRNNRGPRDFRDASPPRDQRQPPQPDEAVGASLPAFITGPVRSTVPESTNDQPPAETAERPVNGAPADAPEDSQHMRPRRRRRPKSEFATAGDGGEARSEAQPTGETAGD